MPASVSLCRKLTGAMRLFDQAEREAAIRGFIEMIENSGIDYTEIRICPADQGTDTDDSYLLNHMQDEINKWQTAAKAAAIKITVLQKKLDVATAECARLAALVPTTKVTYARWQCLDGLANGGEPTDKRSYTACQKAGWVTPEGCLTAAGRAAWQTGEPPLPKARESIKKLRQKIEIVERERDTAYDRIDKILTVLESPADYPRACLMAVNIGRGCQQERGYAY